MLLEKFTLALLIMIKIAINGFGRIGRHTFRRILDNHSDLEVVAINDLSEPEILAHLLRYDSLYGIYKKTVKFTKNELLIDGMSAGKKVQILAEKDPANLPWKELGIDIVLECSGSFTDYEGAKKHLNSWSQKSDNFRSLKKSGQNSFFCFGGK